MTKIKKVAAGILAAVTMATCVTSLSASADVYRSFKVGNEYASANGYRGNSSASAGTTLSKAFCGVTVIFGGDSDSDTGTGSCHISVSGYGGSATSTHTASKGGYSGSTSMKF